MEAPRLEADLRERKMENNTNCRGSWFGLITSRHVGKPPPKQTTNSNHRTKAALSRIQSKASV
jgi:hypothetical protein